MTAAASPRRRRTPQAARADILAAAERLLAEAGIEAVQVRAVARLAGMTDAGVSHHFGDRQGLLQALIEDAGARLRAATDAIVADWLAGEVPAGDVDVEQLLRALALPYRRGYAELAVALHAAGWRDRGDPIFGRVAEVLHAARLARTSGSPPPSLEDTRLTVAAFHQAIAVDALYGEGFRRSAGVKAQSAKNPEPQLAWWIATVRMELGL